MEMAGVCPVCSELSRSLKKFEKQLSEERRWNISQREYCMQLQQEMQKDKDLWQRQENKLRENIKDLSNKLEDLYKTIQDQHKENAHLEYKNEVLEDHKQELQDKVTMLQDKVKHLCAEMSTVQYRARMLEEKLTATTKLLEESHKLKARISQAEGQKSRLEMKANRLQEEKQQMQAELNHMRDENCQMQMQLIELQQNLSCLDAGPQQMQVNHALQKKPEGLTDIDHLRDSNKGCRENNNFTDDCAAVNGLQLLRKEMENKGSNSTTFQNNCILRWQQRTAFDNGDAAAIHQVNERMLAPKEVEDNATKCYDLDLHLIEECVDEKGIKRSCSRSKDNQKTMILDEDKTVYEISELDRYNACSSCGNEIQMNIHKEDLENIKKASHITTISENVGNLRETTIRSSIGYTLKYGDENDSEIPISVSAANVTHVTFADKADNLKEASLCKNNPCMSSEKDDFLNLSSIEPESFAAPDNEVKWNTLHALSHEQAEEFRNGTECTCYYEEKQTNVGTLHPRLLFHGASMSQSVACYNEISGENEENKIKYARNFTHCTKESTNSQHSTVINSNGSENTDIVSNSATNFGPTETNKDNHSDNSSSPTEHLSKNSKNIESRKEGITTETSTSITDASQIGNPGSVKSLEKEALEGVTNNNKGSSSTLSKKTDNRTDNQLANKKNKPQYNKCNQTEKEIKLNEVSEKAISNLERSSQRLSSRNNESSNSENRSQRSSPRKNEGSSNPENVSQRASPKNNESSSNSKKSSQSSSSENNEGSSNSEKRSQRISPRINEGRSNSENRSQRSSPRNNEGGSNSEKSSQRASPKNNEDSSNSENRSQRSSPRNNEGSSNSERSSQRASPKNNEGNSISAKRSQRASPRSNGLNKNREKLSDLNNKYKRMENTQQCKGNNHSGIASKSLNKNNNNTNHLVHKINTHVCSRNIQTENEILNDNVTLQCETSNEGHVNSEKTLGTMHKGACSSNKIRGELNVLSKNNNNILKPRHIPQCNKNIQTENGIQHISLNNTAITVDDSSVHKQHSGQYIKDGVKNVALNKNINSTDDTMVHKKTTSIHNRDIHSDIGIMSSILNNNNNNVSDINFIHKRSISKYDKNIHTQNGVHSTDTADDNIVCRKNTSQYNGNAHSEKGITLIKSTDGKLRYKKNFLLSNKDVQRENGLQSSTSYKNNNSCYLMNKNVSQSVNEIPSTTLCKRNSSVEDDLVQKTIISQCSKSIQTENGAQAIVSSKNDIMDGNLVHERNKLHNHQNTQIENTIQSTDLSKNGGDKVEYKKNSLQCNKDIQNGTVMQSIVLSKHNSTNNDLPQKMNMAQADQHVRSENEIQYPSLGNKSNTVDDKLSYKINALQQSISSSSKNNTVNDNLEQSNKNIKNENGVQSSDLNKNDTTKDADHQHRKNTTQWNKDVLSKQGVHPIALNKSAIDNYFAYRRNTLKCEKCEETKSRIQPITAYKRNGFVAGNDPAYTCNIPQSNVCIQNQNEIKLIALNENKCNVDNNLVREKNTPQCSKDHGSHPSQLELEVLHEAGNTCMINCNTSSSEMCNDMLNSNIKERKTLTQINSLSTSEEMSLVSAVKEGKFSTVEELLSLGTSPNCVYNGNTALHAAAETANLCMCRLLLEAGARADARNSFSGTPLHAAAKCGNLEVGKLLVKWGASIELRDKAGHLPSDIAVNNGHLQMYNWLQQQICLQEQ